MKKKYTVLRFISRVYRFGGIALFILTIPTSIYFGLPFYSYYGSSGFNFFSALTIAIPGILVSIGMIGFGMLITMMIEMQQNLQMTTSAIEHLSKSSSISPTGQ